MIRFLTFAVRKVAFYETLEEYNMSNPLDYPFLSYFWLWLKKIGGDEEWK